MPKPCATSPDTDLNTSIPDRSATTTRTTWKRSSGYITRNELTGYKTITRAPIRGTYRGFEIIGPPPPSSGPLHIVQMLNILEGYNIGALGFGSVETIHLLAEVLKIAFADRTAVTADPAFVTLLHGPGPGCE
jgi:gamma-glutamyltranspeptidase/glutathione hydrolase